MGVVWQKWAWSPKIFRRAPRAHSFKEPPFLNSWIRPWDTQQHRAAIVVIHDHYLIQIPVSWPLARNRLPSSLSDHRYGHQCNHHPAGAPICVLYIVYFKSCHPLARKVSPIGTICPSSRIRAVVNKFIQAHMDFRYSGDWTDSPRVHLRRGVAGRIYGHT